MVFDLRLKGNTISNNFTCYFVFSIVAFALVSDFTSSGYILTLDTVFAKNVFQISDTFFGLSPSYSVTPFLAFLNFLNIFFSVEFIQKLSFFLIFFVSGFSAYKMCPEDRGIGRYFAGFLYMLNPFIYVRFLAGHWLLLIAYAVTPFVVKAFMDFFEIKSTRNTIYIAFLLTFVFVLETHTPFLLLVLFAVFYIVKLTGYRENHSNISSLSRSCALFGILLLILNSYWLVPNFIGSSVPLGDITGSDLYAFTTKQDFNFNTLFTVESMYGFWRSGYIYTKDLLPYWYLFFVFIFILAVHGFISNYDHSKHGVYVKAFGAVAVLSVLLAAGISGPFAGGFEFLFNNVFFFKGFREPQKFVALLVLSYAYLGGLGVAEFEKIVKGKTLARFNAKKIIASLVIILALATPFIYSFTMFNGFWGQLKPADYPKDWYETNEFLNQDTQDFKILFLPWHAYMDFKWLPNAQKRLANPASIFFDKPVIQGDNMEAGGIYSSSSSPVSKYMEFLLSKRDKIDNFGELIAPLNIKYVILTKEVDYKLYDFLYDQTDLEPVKDTENLVVFKNRHPVHKIYQVDSISTIRSWDDLLETSRNEDIMGSAFVFGNKTDIRISQMKALNYSEEYPVLYNIEKPSLKYVVFTEKYSQDWKFGSIPPNANFGVGNVYAADRIEGLSLYYERFNVYLAGYIISGVAFVVLIVIYFRERRKEKRKKEEGILI